MRTKLHDAAQKGDVKLIQALVRQGIDVNEKEEEGRAALHVAAEWNREKAIECLVLTCGADVHAVDKNGWTALHWAAMTDHEKAIECLVLKCGADVDAVNTDGLTALDVATLRDHKKVIECLVLTCGAKEINSSLPPLNNNGSDGEEDTVVSLNSFIDEDETESALHAEIDYLENLRDGEVDNVSSYSSKYSIASSQFVSTDKSKIARELMKRIQQRAPHASVTIKNNKQVKIEWDEEDGVANNKALQKTLQVLFKYANVTKEEIIIPWDDLVDTAIQQFRVTYQAQVDSRATLPQTPPRKTLKQELLDRALTDCLKEISKNFQPQKPYTCFVSYSWGNDYVKQVATLVDHLRLAGFEIPFDLDNGPGNTTTRYIQKIDKVDFIVVIGTKKLLEKYELCHNDGLEREPVVKAELELICDSYMHNEARKKRIRTTLWEGTVDEAFPPLLRTLVRIEEFKKDQYIEGVFELIRSLYGIDRKDEAFNHIKQTYYQYAHFIEQDQNLKKGEKQFQEQQNQARLQPIDEAQQWKQRHLQQLGLNTEKRTSPSRSINALRQSHDENSNYNPTLFSGNVSNNNTDSDENYSMTSNVSPNNYSAHN